LKIECLVDGVLVREEAQFASLNFKYRGDTDVPVVVYKNKMMKPGTITGFITLLMMKSSLLCAHDLRTCVRVLVLLMKMGMQTGFFSLLSKS
jgi:hypothetical protein